MKAMLSAFVAIIAISAGSNLILQEAGWSAQDRTTSDAVRLD